MICLDRGQIGKKPGVDITVKSATGIARVFAPTWPMVTGHQAHTLDNSEYMLMYRAILAGVPLEAWAQLENMQAGGTLTLLCYCADENHDGGRKFCHTHILIEYMMRSRPKDYVLDGDVGVEVGR